MRRINGARRPPSRAVVAVMQLGSLGGPWAVGAVVARRDRSRGAAVAIAGSATWGGAKLVKRFVRRDRPSGLLEGILVHGRPQTGLGFPSGHAAVAACTAVTASGAAGRPVDVALAAAAGLTGLTRIRVGAHLPLDVVGGWGLGVLTGALGVSVLGRVRPWSRR